MLVEPEAVSDHLRCSICHNVLEKPVETGCEHLFCEDELLEWMCRSDRCPVCNRSLDADQIRKPSRVVCNLLADVAVKCRHHEHGWCAPRGAISRARALAPARSRARASARSRSRARSVSRSRARVSRRLARRRLTRARARATPVRRAACRRARSTWQGTFETLDAHSRGA